MIFAKPQSLNHYKDLALASTGLKQSLVNIFGSSLASGFAALSLIIISRYLGPVYFGQFSTAFALLLILVRFNDLGLSIATSKLVPATQDQTIQQTLLGLIFRYRLALSGIIIVAGFIFSQFLPSFLLTDNSSLILLAFLLSIAISFFEHTQFSLQALHQFKLAAILNGSQGILKLLLSLPFIFLILQSSFSLSSAVILIFIFYMIAPAIPTLIIKLINPARLPLSINLPQSEAVPSLNKKIWQITKHAGLGIVAAGIIENIDILFVQAYLTNYEAGLLAGVSRIALLLYVLAYALGNVLNPRVARYVNIENLKKFWNKAWLIVAFSIVGFVLSMILAEPLIMYSIGVEYLPALGLMRILLAAGFVTIAGMPFIAMFYSFNLPWYFSVSGVVQLIIILVGNGLLIPEYGVNASAWTRLVARVVLLVMTIVLARYHLNKQLLTTDQKN